MSSFDSHCSAVGFRYPYDCRALRQSRYHELKLYVSCRPKAEVQFSLKRSLKIRDTKVNLSATDAIGTLMPG